MKKIAFFVVLMLALTMSGCAETEITHEDPVETPEIETPVEIPADEEPADEEPADEEPADEEPAEMTVSLYYYNIEKDREIADYLPCSEDAVLPVERTIASTKTPLKDTLNLLLEGEVFPEESEEGFQTEFPSAEFKLESAVIEDKTATLTFSDPEGFTVGGSCRTGLLYQQVRKTALQFDTVDEVIILPETLFQP